MRPLILIIALILLTACGQKGALYLPSEEIGETSAETGSENSSLPSADETVVAHSEQTDPKQTSSKQKGS